jgi:hypothetical protein
VRDIFSMPACPRVISKHFESPSHRAVCGSAMGSVLASGGVKLVGRPVRRAAGTCTERVWDFVWGFASAKAVYDTL